MENRSLKIKVNVTPEQKDDLKSRSDAAGLSLSSYLLTVGLARQTGITAERNLEHVELLGSVLSRLLLISEECDVRGFDSLLVIQKLSQIERLIIMLAPEVSAAGPPK